MTWLEGLWWRETEKLGVDKNEWHFFVIEGAMKYDNKNVN